MEDIQDVAHEVNVGSNPIVRYGTPWPIGSNDVSIELACYRFHPEHTHDSKVKTPHPRSFHMKNAIKLLWPENFPGGKRGYIFSKWSNERIEAWCEDEFQEGDCDFQTWWGPSSTGKSTDAAVIALTHWLSAPNRTTITVCSTTSKMLEKRIWGEILKYYNLHSASFPGTYYKSKMAILLGDEDSKNGIFGIAVQKGTTEEAIGNIIGVHNDFNVLIIDEQQATRPAATEAFDNLSTGIEAKFLGMGNPVSWLDSLGRSSKPKKGVKSIHVGKPMQMHSKHWETEKGKTIFFSGLDSPGIDDPVKFCFLLNRKQIDKLRVDPGENSPRFWSQRIGFVAPEGLVQTVLTEKFVTRFSMQDKPEWLNEERTMVAGLDESFTIDGDKAILEIAEVGETVSGEMCVNFLEPKSVMPIADATSTDPLEFRMAKDVIGICEDYGVKPEHFGVDTSATQTAFASIIEQEWREKIFRCSFGVSATELPVSASDDRKAKEAYKNRVTELWYNMREFGKNNQIRGLHDNAVIQFCNRLVLTDGIKVFVEPKKEYKSRTSESPDIADAHVIILAIVREVLGINPGGELGFGETDDPYELARDFDVDSNEDNYIHSALDDTNDAGESEEMEKYIRQRHKEMMRRAVPGFL